MARATSSPRALSREPRLATQQQEPRTQADRRRAIQPSCRVRTRSLFLVPLVVATLVAALGLWCSPADATLHLSPRARVVTPARVTRPGLLARPEWLRAAVRRGPCSPMLSAVHIRIANETDIALRLLYPATQTVVLRFLGNMTLTRPLELNSSYACTILIPDTERTYVQLYYHALLGPAVFVNNTGNILMTGISLRTPVSTTHPICPQTQFKQCPALLILRSFSIQYTKSLLIGHIMVRESVRVLIDSNRIIMSRAFGLNLDGVVHFQKCAVGALRAPRKSRNVVSNNEISNGFNLIVIDTWTAGVIVRNNYLHTFKFSALRCGNGANSVMDCHLNYIAYNYIYTPPGFRTTGDSTGLYFTIKWFNPGNRIECNYIIGGDHCLYFDFSSSGLVVNGGVCSGTKDGVKLNTGKWNKIRSLIMANVSGTVSMTSCVTVDIVHCFRLPGLSWENKRTNLWNLRVFNKPYPYMERICQQPTAPTHNGIQCNPPGSPGANETGYCTGLPMENDFEYLLLDPVPSNRPRDFCQSYPMVGQMNRLVAANVSSSRARIIGNGDFGLRPRSPLLRGRRKFKSCPRALVGPQTVNNATYALRWNMPRPSQLLWLVRTLRFQ